jgi:G:T/U-mismatch repair DNA glycosylase
MVPIRLKEILHPRLDILFLALNPPSTSNANAHYFSNNLSFWNLLYEAGLIHQRVRSKYSGDEEVFRSQSINYKNLYYGVTDLVHDVVETNSSKVWVDAPRVNRIVKLLESRPTKILCLMHRKVSQAFSITNMIQNGKEYGCVGRYKNTSIYEVPFHNASVPDKVQYYAQLRKHFEVSS